MTETCSGAPAPIERPAREDRAATTPARSVVILRRHDDEEGWARRVCRWRSAERRRASRWLDELLGIERRISVDSALALTGDYYRDTGLSKGWIERHLAGRDLVGWSP